MWAYWLLVVMMVIAIAAPAILFARRWKEIPRRPAKHDYYSREFALFLGSSALVFVALFVIVGTSSPIISDLLYGKKSAVDISYYATTTLPLGIAMGLLMGFGQLLWWTLGREAFVRSLAPLLSLTRLVLVLVAFGVSDIVILLFLFGAAFALSVNVQVGWTIVRGNPKLAGGAIAHIGIAVMFFGFIASSEYDATQTVSLPQGTPVEALGYRLTYEGYSVREGDHYAFAVIEKDGRSFHLAPVMYSSSYNEASCGTRISPISFGTSTWRHLPWKSRPHVEERRGDGRHPRRRGSVAANQSSVDGCDNPSCLAQRSCGEPERRGGENGSGLRAGFPMTPMNAYTSSPPNRQ
jgi:cytochrome c-type biogenesis protein CcmF